MWGSRGVLLKGTYRRLPVAVAVMFMSAAFYIGVGYVGLPAAIANLVRSGFYLVFPASAVVMTGLAARGAHLAERRTWRLLTGGMFFILIGEVIWAERQLTVVPSGEPETLLFDIVMIIGYALIALFVLSLLRDRLASLRPLDRLRHALDGLVVVTLWGCALAIVLVQPWMRSRLSTADSSLGFSFVDVMLLAVFVVIIRAGGRVSGRSWQTFAAAGTGVGAVAHTLLNIMLTQHVYQVGSLQNSLLDSLWMLAYFMVAIAGATYVGSEHDTPLRRRPVSTKAYWGDFVPVGAGLVIIPLAMSAARSEAANPHTYWTLVAAATLLTVFVAARGSVLAISNRELASMSATDPLTGVHNHRYFQEHLDLELVRAERTNTALTLVLVDIDQFRDVNETHGHLAGDQALRLVGAALQESVRSLMDIPCRVGGDEFAILLPAADAQEAIRIFYRIKSLLSARQSGVDERLTVSAGIASYPSHATSREGLIRAADSALYVAKRCGKNQAAVYDATDMTCLEADGALGVATKLAASEPSVAEAAL